MNAADVAERGKNNWVSVKHWPTESWLFKPKHEAHEAHLNYDKNENNRVFLKSLRKVPSFIRASFWGLSPKPLHW